MFEHAQYLGASKILTARRGINDQITGFTEEVFDPKRAEPILEYEPFSLLTKREGSNFRMSLLEAWISQPDAANLLRSDIKYIAFSTYAGYTPIWQSLARIETSNKPEEFYLRDGTMGTIPRAPSGRPVDFVQRRFDGAVEIKNYLYRAGVEILGDDIKFDRLGVIRQIAADLGRAARITEEYEFMVDITTTANYTSTTASNDVGNNTGTDTFNALTIDNAVATIGTAKDRGSGANYLGFRADTIITTPKMEFPVKQFLLSNEVSRQATAASAEVRGMGTSNPYNGVFNRIIISPYFGSTYEWAICDSTAYSYVWQTVDPWAIMQEGMTETSESWLIRNALRYVIAGYFGHGFVDDRAWYFSNSTTAPTVS